MTKSVRPYRVFEPVAVILAGVAVVQVAASLLAVLFQGQQATTSVRVVVTTVANTPDPYVALISVLICVGLLAAWPAKALSPALQKAVVMSAGAALVIAAATVGAVILNVVDGESSLGVRTSAIAQYTVRLATSALTLWLAREVWAATTQGAEAGEPGEVSQGPT